jgi:hypothetical protein
VQGSHLLEMRVALQAAFDGGREAVHGRQFSRSLRSRRPMSQLAFGCTIDLLMPSLPSTACRAHSQRLPDVKD